MENQKFRLNLRLFDGGDGAGAAGGAVSSSDAGNTRANPLADVVYGKQPTAEQAETQDAAETTTSEPAAEKPEDKQAAFEKLIREEYKEQFAARTQSIIDKRFKESKQLEEQLGKARPILDMLAQKYGVDPGDLEKLSSAIEEDDSYYEDEATRRGLTVQQLKEMKRIERENETLRRNAQEKDRREEAERVYADWVRQGDELKSVYPTFDLQTECQNEQFVGLLRSNIDVRTAYEVVHRDEILGGAMQYAVQQASQKIVNGIKAKGSRPTENGVSSGSAAVVKSDVNALTKKDREEIERRVMRGERISF